MKKWNLKLLYLLSLGALCLWVTAGPVGASVYLVPTIDCDSIGDYGFNDITVVNNDDPQFVRLAPNEVELTLEVQCGDGGGCSGDVPIWVLGDNVGYFLVTLDGASTGSASGTMNLGSVTEPWSVGLGGGTIPAVSFDVPGNGLGNYTSLDGDLHISSMAANSILNFMDPPIITGNAIPEPGSMALLIGGIALVEFLRRKSRA
jgi:hypothetical protein